MIMRYYISGCYCAIHRSHWKNPFWCRDHTKMSLWSCSWISITLATNWCHKSKLLATRDLQKETFSGVELRTWVTNADFFPNNVIQGRVLIFKRFIIKPGTFPESDLRPITQLKFAPSQKLRFDTHDTRPKMWISRQVFNLSKRSEPKVFPPKQSLPHPLFIY